MIIVIVSLQICCQEADYIWQIILFRKKRSTIENFEVYTAITGDSQFCQRLHAAMVEKKIPPSDSQNMAQLS